MSDDRDSALPSQWMRFNVAMPDHFKVRRLARALKIAPEYALGIVWATWGRLAKNHPDGCCAGMTADDLTDLAGGFPGAGEALIACGFFDADGDRPVGIHDFDEYNGMSKEAQRARKYREKKKLKNQDQSEEERDENVTRHDASRRERDACAYVNTSRLVDPPKEDPSPEGVQGEPVELFPKGPEPADPDQATPEAVFDLYQAIVANGTAWVKHRHFSNDDKPKLAKRIRERPERRSLAWWRSLFERIAERVTWPEKLGLEFIIRSDGQVQKFDEGGFDDREPKQVARPPTIAEETMAKAKALRESASSGSSAGSDLIARLRIPAPKRSGYVARAPPVEAIEQGAFGFVVDGGDA